MLIKKAFVFTYFGSYKDILIPTGKMLFKVTTDRVTMQRYDESYWLGMKST